MSIIRFLHGSVTLNELINMSFNEYVILKYACELEQIKERMTNIHDMNHAFNSSKDIIERLKRDYDKILTSISGKSSNKSISWKSNIDGIKKLKSMQR